MDSDGRNLVPSRELRLQLERLATIVRKPKGTILFRRGDPASGLYLVHSGEVSLTLDSDGPIFPRRILRSDCIAGLPSTVSGSAYSLTAQVLEDAELAFVPRSAVLNLLQQDSSMCFQVMEMLSGEISEIRSAFKSTDLCRRRA